MPNTYSALYYHFVFSTKDRAPLITPDIQERLWEYLGGILRENDGVALRIGEIEDHVHILCAMSPSTSPSRMVQQVKGGSSKWIHANFSALAGFGWQDGYGAFTVTRSTLDAVGRYIDNQREHHRRVTFVEEYRAFLDKHGVKYDERYLF